MRNISRNILAAVCVALLASCAHMPDGPGGPDCAALCANVERLACSWAPADCPAWCAHYEQLGVDVANECASRAADCDAIDQCGGAGGDQ